MTTMSDTNTETKLTAAEALDDLEAGDRVLWGDRKQPCTVARVVEPGDRVGQALTASVIHISDAEREAQEASEYEDYWLEDGDVFVDPRVWGRLTGKTFVVIQGPRGGFYAIAEPESGRRQPAMFRAVRSFHSTHKGRPGQGAWKYQQDFQGKIRVVEHGDEPDDLDPVGDLPAYDEIKDNRTVGYDLDRHEHYVVADTLEGAFDAGLGDAYERAEAAAKGDETETDDDGVPVGAEPERVAGTARGVGHATATVTAIVDTSYGKKGALEAPAPWDMPDDATPINDVIKSLPWEECHYEFDADDKRWLVDAEELSAVASELRDHGFDVTVEYDRDELLA